MKEEKERGAKAPRSFSFTTLLVIPVTRAAIPAQAGNRCAAGVFRHCEERNDEAILPPLTPPKEGN